LIKGASERLILISPFLKLNDRMKELLEDKNRLKIDVRIVYGKSELQPQEIEWLRGLTYIRTSFCKNLHAKREIFGVRFQLTQQLPRLKWVKTQTEHEVCGDVTVWSVLPVTTGLSSGLNTCAKSRAARHTPSAAR
jgi:hypothetical protein